jgi:hypothetical protein
VDSLQVSVAMYTKAFDCVKMKRLGAEKVREETATMTREEEVRFWQERSRELRQPDRGELAREFAPERDAVAELIRERAAEG